jgi:stearoyl-CoA desaturase (Delta-9 desaturase)
MTPLARRINLTAAILPIMSLVGAVILVWGHGVDSFDLGLLVVMYVLTGFGVTVGFHRLFAHRSFAAARPVELTLAVLGQMALQGPVVDWVADHRKHHTFSDEEGDPHSPHVGFGSGFTGVVRGLWHAHVGWLFETNGQAEKRRYCPDLAGDPIMRRINRGFPLIVLATLAIPFVAGWAWGGTVDAGLEALLWAGLVRIFLVHHVTWSINSICHFFGARRFETGDHSTNVFWLALPSLGEAWHHNHHAFPRSAFHGLRWYELDVSGWLIMAMAKVGLAWDVIRIAPDAQRAKLAGAAAQQPAAETAAAA